MALAARIVGLSVNSDVDYQHKELYGAQGQRKLMKRLVGGWPGDDAKVTVSDAPPRRSKGLGRTLAPWWPHQG